MLVKTRLDDDDGELGDVTLTLLLSLSTVFSTAVDRRLTRFFGDGLWLAMAGPDEQFLVSNSAHTPFHYVGIT